MSDTKTDADGGMSMIRVALSLFHPDEKTRELAQDSGEAAVKMNDCFAVLLESEDNITKDRCEEILRLVARNMCRLRVMQQVQFDNPLVAVFSEFVVERQLGFLGMVAHGMDLLGWTTDEESSGIVIEEIDLCAQESKEHGHILGFAKQDEADEAWARKRGR